MEHWLLWFCGLGTLLTALLLPFPLYLYAVITCPRVYVGERENLERGWRKTVVNLTSNYVKNAVAGMLLHSGSSRLKGWGESVVAFGRLPAPKLWEYIRSSEERLCGASWFALGEISREELLRLATRVGYGEENVPVFGEKCAAYFLSQNGSVEQVVPHLLACRESVRPFHHWLINGILAGRCSEFLCEFKIMAGGSSPYREQVLRCLVRFVSPEERQSLWQKYAADPCLTRRREAALALCEYPDPEALEGFIPIYLSDPSIVIRRLPVMAMVRILFRRAQCRDQVIEWGKLLLKLLDDPDLPIRRGAAWSLAALSDNINLWGHLESIMPDMWKSTTRRVNTWDCSTPVPETQAEVAEREKIRVMAQEWLKKQENK